MGCRISSVMNLREDTITGLFIWHAITKYELQEKHIKTLHFMKGLPYDHYYDDSIISDPIINRNEMILRVMSKKGEI